VRIAAANLSLYHSIIRPILFSLSPESAHEFALKTLNISAIRACFKQKNRFPEFGTLKRFGLDFSNPVGLAAGFDKNGTAAHALADLGFGFIEVGTVTNEPQPGNPKTATVSPAAGSRAGQSTGIQQSRCARVGPAAPESSA
jgi:dihydroorotate dehydrogenase